MSSTHLVVESLAVAPEDDSCVRWMEERLRRRSAGNTEAAEAPERVLESLKVDASICSALRWSKFAFPSAPHTPLSANYKSTPSASLVTVERVGESDDSTSAEGTVYKLTEKQHRGHKGGAPFSSSNFFTQPSYHLIREVVKKKQLEDYNTATGGDKDEKLCSLEWRRPFWGGYVTTTDQRGSSLRFLLFPQRGHGDDESAHAGRATPTGVTTEILLQRSKPQSVPFLLQGTARWLPGPSQEEIVQGTGNPLSLRDAFGLNLQYSRVFSATTAAPSLWWYSLRPPRWLASADVFVSLCDKRIERRYAEAKNKVEKRVLHRDSVECAFGGVDPRWSATVRTSTSSVHNSHLFYTQKTTASDTTREKPTTAHDDRIAHVGVSTTYDSSERTFALPSMWPRKGSGKKAAVGKYGIKAETGCGVEQLRPGDADARGTAQTPFVFAKTEGHVEVPLWGRVILTLRNQSALVRPVMCGSHDDGSGHTYFWATQGPTWNPKLLRGFDNDFSSLHTARHWYSLFSLELNRGNKKKVLEVKPQNGGSGGSGTAADAKENTDSTTTNAVTVKEAFQRSAISVFANTCVVDTLREHPKASVGFTMASVFPRWELSRFNVFVPHHYECSMSWLIDFARGELQTGVDPAVPEELQFLRVSPVETFRHLKCGVTWKL